MQEVAQTVRATVEHVVIPGSGRSGEPEPFGGGGAAVWDEHVLLALTFAARSVAAVYRPLLRPLGLTYTQYLVMLVLWKHERMAVTKLAAAVQLRTNTLSPLLNRLLAVDLVTKERGAGDERSVIIGLSAQGRELQHAAADVPEQVLARLSLSPQRLAVLPEALAEVIRACNAIPALASDEA